MSIERLSAEDQIMLWPDEIWPQDIGALAILDGGDLFDAAGRFRIEVVKAAIAARLHLLPRFRHLLSVPPPAQGGPHWVDAPASCSASPNSWWDIDWSGRVPCGRCGSSPDCPTGASAGS
jgi:hypothetical protein